MDLFEFVLAFSFLIVLPLSIVKAVLVHKREQAEPPAGITAGDLRRLVQETVEDGNAPILARIDELEARLQAGRLVDGFDAEPEVQERTLGRRVSE